MKNTKRNQKCTRLLFQGTRLLKRLLPVLFSIVIPLSVCAQKSTITGLVVDSKSEPIIGASVLVKGSKVGAITNIDGKFTIEASSTDVLVFSYIGMNPQEVTVGSSKNMKVVMVDNSQALEEVVVIGYGTAKKKDLTTAVSVVSTKDVSQRPIVSAVSAIQGKAAGVNITSPNGQPGETPIITIRGNTSINASNTPLYVVDGVPMKEINFLSPNDMESIQILKDASSAAIYGSNGANGVVIITTKLGEKGEAKISFNTHIGTTQVVKKIKSLNSSQYKMLMDEIGAVTLPDGLTDKTDWFNETYRTGFAQNYQLSISNGTDKMKYFLSGGYTKESGVIPVAYYKRYNLRANLENQIRTWLKLNTNLSYSDYSKNGIISGTGSNRAGVILSVINTPTYATIWDENNPKQYYNNFYGAQVTHPIENMSRTENDKSSNNRLVGSASTEIIFIRQLKLKSSVSIDRVYYNATSFLDPVKTAYGRSLYGTAHDERSLSTIMVYDNVLTFEKNLNKHNLNIMLGTSGTTSTWNQSYMDASHFNPEQTVQTLNAANKIEQGSGTSASEWSTMSYISRLAYNFESKYLFTASYRADGSSKLNPSNRWGYFPALSVAWRISSENFMKGIDWIDDLKIRGGWGQTGNTSGISDYSYLQQYTIERLPWYDKSGNYANAVPALGLYNMSNTDLTWETTSQTNIGLDFTVLKNRVNLSIDAYYKYTKNLIFDIDLPATSYLKKLQRNEGEMSNKGLDITLNTKNLVGKLKWESDFVFSLNRNKVEKLTLQQVYYDAPTSEATSENVVRMTTGRPMGGFWGYISEGVDPETGNLKYKTQDSNGVLKLSDKTYIGDPNPDFTFGFTNNFFFKGFALNLFFQGSYGNDIYNASRMETEGMYDAKNQSVAVLDRWKRPGMVTYMPRATATKENLLASTRFVEDGSYIRLKTLSLSYSFSGRLMKKLNITRLQPYFTAQNLFTLTRYRGFDPEVNQWGGYARVQGVDWGTYPQSKSYVFGINVDF